VVALRAAYPEEFPLETFVGLLEKGEDDSSCHPTEAYPEVLPRAFGFEEMKKNIYSGWMTKMVAEDGEGPHKGPVVRMQLGRGNVYFGQQLPLEAGKRKALPNTLKDRLIEEEEEEGFSLVGMVVYAHGFGLCAWANRDIGVALSPKCPTLELKLAI